MFLIYSREHPSEVTAEEFEQLRAGHRVVHDETKKLGIFERAQRLKPPRTATTLRMENGKPLVLDGPFAETKEQLAGYYILDCANLDEAIEWAKKIPTACKVAEGCVEIRPIAEIPPR
jgi:hypothetical protein